VPEKVEAQAREIIKTWLKNGPLVSREYENTTERKEAGGVRRPAAVQPALVIC
jgi:hypothetical protein